MNSVSDQSKTHVARSYARRRTFAILAGAVLLTILVLTMLPTEVKQHLHTRGRFHTAGHVIVFTVLAFTAGRASRSWGARFVLVLSLTGFGFLTELAEHLFYGTGLEWRDVLGDGAGVFLGSSIALLTAGHIVRSARFRSS